MTNQIRLSPQALFISHCKEIIAEHRSELTIRRNQLTRTSSEAAVDNTKWTQEVEFFIDQIVEPQANISIRHSPERLNAVRSLIDAATVHYLSSRICFRLDNAHSPYEQLVSDSLSDLGWHTHLIEVNDNDRADVIAEMRDKRILIHCRRYASSLGILAIESVQQRRSALGAAYGVIVSDGKFTDRARQLATPRTVILLHHNQLMQLEERLVGTDSWRSIAPRTVQSERAGPLFFEAAIGVPDAA
jgi:hypothetical protein